MKKDYVICKGKRYNSGDTILIWWYVYGYGNAWKYTGTFIDCDEEKDEYRFIVDGQTYCYNRVCFNRIIRVEQDESQIKKNGPRQATFKDELNIDGLFLAWLWYVFIMLVAIIFNDRIGIWILASIIFFSYRKKKLKEAGYK